MSKSKPHKTGKNQLKESCLLALTRIAEYVHRFPYVKNPVTQWTQRGVNGTLRINGKPFTIESEAGWIPARRGVTVRGVKRFEFNKRFASAILAAYESGTITDPITEVESVLVYLGLSINTSRPRSLEGSLKANLIRIIEQTTGLRIEDESTQANVESFIQYLENSLKANVLPEVRGKRINRASDLGL
jgi:hypothetical protein